MADDTKMVNSEYVDDDQMVNIGGDEISDYELKIAELSDEISALEKEKQQVVYENNNLNDTIEKMKESMKHLSAENEGMKEQVEKFGLENKGLHAVAARASELEGQVSRLQHDLISAMSDLQDVNGENLKLKSKVESFENGEMEKSIKMDAAVSERDLLIEKVEDLVAKAAEKEKEIRGLEGRIEELKLAVRDKEELEGKVRELEGKLEEKERVINGLELKQRQIAGLVNGEAPVVVEEEEEEDEDDEVYSVIEGRKKNFVGRFKDEWPVVAVSTVGAVAVMGVMCYMHYKKR